MNWNSWRFDGAHPVCSANLLLAVIGQDIGVCVTYRRIMFTGLTGPVKVSKHCILLTEMTEDLDTAFLWVY